MNLFAFEKFGSPKPQYQGAPRLVPIGSISGPGANNIAKDSSSYGLIDVVNNFQWTTSPKSSRMEVPAIFLKEKRLKNNSLYAQVAYYGMALGGILGGAAGGLTALNSSIRPFVTSVLGGFGAGTFTQVLNNALGQLTSYISGNAGAAESGIFSSNITRIAEGVGAIAGWNATPETIQAGVNAIASISQQLGRFTPDNFNIPSLNSDILSPYEGLYITEDTKFIYNMPYFSNEQNTVNNMFGDFDEVMGEGGIDPLNAYGAAKNVRAAANFVSGTVNFDAPGIYIEKPKFFNFKETGEQIRFSFPLINTGWSTFEDVVQNWQLMYMLAYQNRPNRRTRDLIDPAVIYEITIPGVRFYPYAYISNMAINFVGARRRMNIRVPLEGGLGTINTIIPDAYVIDITFTTLVSETQNFLYACLHDKQDIITTSSSRSPFDIFGDDLSKNYSGALKQNLNPNTQSSANNLLNAAGDFVPKVINTFKQSPLDTLGGGL
jgi:hypothetical protein